MRIKMFALALDATPELQHGASWFISILFVFLAAALLWTLIMLIRNRKVSKYRGRLIENIYQKNIDELKHITNLADLEEHKKIFDLRWKHYEDVSYDEMVWKFWKSLDSFYTDLSSLQSHRGDLQGNPDSNSSKTIH